MVETPFPRVPRFHTNMRLKEDLDFRAYIAIKKAEDADGLSAHQGRERISARFRPERLSGFDWRLVLGFVHEITEDILSYVALECKYFSGI